MKAGNASQGPEDILQTHFQRSHSVMLSLKGTKSVQGRKVAQVGTPLMRAKFATDCSISPITTFLCPTNYSALRFDAVTQLLI